MAGGKLTVKGVTALKNEGRYGDGDGLWLVVNKNGAKRWVYRFRRPDTGKATEMGLGSADIVSLAEAREKATEARKSRHSEGQNPIAVRDRSKRANQAIPTFKIAAADYISAHESGWKNPKHIAQWKMTIERYCAPIHNLPVNEITTADIVALLEPIWSKVPETANRVRGRIEMVLDRCRTLGHIDANARNPAQWKGHLDKALKRKKTLVRGHHAAMDYKKLPAFLERVRAMDTTAAYALEFTILTGARTTETLEAVWSEFDLNNKLWTVPAGRMKGSRVHHVPLCTRAIEILNLMNEGRVSDFVFPGQKRKAPLSDMAMESVLRRLGVNTEATVHGFRSSLRDYCGDETDYPREVAEAALAHAVGDKAEQAYRRGSALEKRRGLMDLWGKFCAPDCAAD